MDPVSLIDSVANVFYSYSFVLEDLISRRTGMLYIVQ